MKPSSTIHFKQALRVLGGLCLGLDLPLTAQIQIAEGKSWDSVGGAGSNSEPDSGGGHAVNAVGHSDQGVVVCTWGKLQLCTWAFIAEYCSEAWALVSTDWLRSAK